jgi:hypothetical protein
LRHIILLTVGDRRRIVHQVGKIGDVWRIPTSLEGV